MVAGKLPESGDPMPGLSACAAQKTLQHAQPVRCDRMDRPWGPYAFDYNFGSLWIDDAGI
ncbi:MAG: hypothetical protein EB114_01305 [Betaproteobacteria bacterium]|nr:hypothetical protein [Betaproteobacteria bacterium]NBQ08733.1 hypothetical protein [Betaproteobacteria bacterium]NBS20730.1 hypothetical protein [Betaproteobacteria bacterium]NBT64330.1 hypothetical protein [Betaproteobacteria bacterium]NCV26018.1 hypothetical protein [Betaproteobacteria bacterium]